MLDFLFSGGSTVVAQSWLEPPTRRPPGRQRAKLWLSRPLNPAS